MLQKIGSFQVKKRLWNVQRWVPDIPVSAVAILVLYLVLVALTCVERRSCMIVSVIFQKYCKYLVFRWIENGTIGGRRAFFISIEPVPSCLTCHGVAGAGRQADRLPFAWTGACFNYALWLSSKGLLLSHIQLKQLYSSLSWGTGQMRCLFKSFEWYWSGMNKVACCFGLLPPFSPPDWDLRQGWEMTSLRPLRNSFEMYFVKASKLYSAEHIIEPERRTGTLGVRPP
jgi:hypothetical protein